MLVLKRKLGQIVRINDDISIMVVKLKNGSVSLGIEAPKEIKVHRQEVYEKTKEAA